MTTYQLILTILNRGYSEQAMDSARKSGATGGTIITARGTGIKKIHKHFGFTVSPEKEILMILSPSEHKNSIMTAICNAVGLNTEGKGIVFSLPVDEVLGIALGINNDSCAPEDASTSENAELPSPQTPSDTIAKSDDENSVKE